MSTTVPPRYPLYTRLPEVHRTRDEEGDGQLRAYLGLAEEVFGEIHRSIEELFVGEPAGTVRLCPERRLLFVRHSRLLFGESNLCLWSERAWRNRQTREI